ncbi:hypothetical protein DAPPUDRAFT_305006 [Daphnia pulex]|uniref:Uncharacterized protein n=1 Tax=Daphnia pulex TaxID=6669 RepID=E9GND6_DAPPU|nr:hypothetical protein DAPPUDRAFT_305006 [Daphnia pulex]|eukprot:EFX79009.1 hypothetical protein DAPPUDRAFT_305006 [Daphnia pulex]
MLEGNYHDKPLGKKWASRERIGWLFSPLRSPPPPPTSQPPVCLFVGACMFTCCLFVGTYRSECVLHFFSLFPYSD